MSHQKRVDASVIDQVIDSGLKHLASELYSAGSRRLRIALEIQGIDSWKADHLATRTATLWADWMEEMKGGHFG